MPRHTNILTIIALLCCSLGSSAQEAAAVDSLKKVYAAAVNAEQKVTILTELSQVLMNVNPREADEYGNKLIADAEESRDRRLMFIAYLKNGLRCSYMASQKIYADKAIAFCNKALEVAQQNNLEEETGEAQLQLAAIYLSIPDVDKALSYTTQAFSLISTLTNDSLRAEAHNAFGQVYQAQNENKLALRNYFIALRIAEKIDNHPLIRNCYLYLSDFYASIENYAKAIDYMTFALKRLDLIKQKSVPYQRVLYTNNIGNLYAQNKSYDIAISYFEKSIRMADTLRFSTLKIPGYVSLLNQYLRIDEPMKALAYMNSPPGDNLKKYLTNFGLGYVINQAYGVIYTEIGRYDSAKIYLEKARPNFESNTNEFNKVNFYGQLASFFRKSGDKKNAIATYQTVIELSKKNGLLENVKKAAQYLDTLYHETNNLALAGQYNALYYQYKDSIESQTRAKELTKEEATDEERRVRDQELQALETKKRRNNIQYMAIVIGIISLFVMLVILGMFKISAGWIKALGFFVFLMMFEFVFLVFKKNIYSVTHGEPWKDLAFMIALAALLVPLHHWLEHNVLHYLTSHNRLTSAGHHIRNKIFRKTDGGEQ
jgi:tetratricopeptide (TPR) repeat protein